MGEGIEALQHLLHGSGSSRFSSRNDIALLAKSGPPLERPRSTWLRDQVSQETFADLASTADASHAGHATYEEVTYRARTVVSLDRAMWAQERGYNVVLRQIGGLCNYAKDDLIVGIRTKQ